MGGFLPGRIKTTAAWGLGNLIHPAVNTEELRAFFQGREGWGAAWRQRDFDYFNSGDFSTLLREREYPAHYLA